MRWIAINQIPVLDFNWMEMYYNYFRHLNIFVELAHLHVKILAINFSTLLCNVTKYILALFLNYCWHVFIDLINAAS